MANVLDVAKVLDELYKKDHDGKRMDKLRMNKLLYYLQREALINNISKPLFPDLFQAWKLGPVMPIVYNEYKHEVPFSGVKGKVSKKQRELITQVYQKYYYVSSWELNRQTHLEFSWKYYRQGIPEGQNGTMSITMDAIKVDAIRERMLRQEQEMLQ